MKTIKTILAIGLAAIAVNANAQKPVQAVGQAFDELYNELYKGGNITSSAQDSYADGNYQYFYFAFPKKNSKAVTKFDKILFDNHAFAYSSLMKKAGTANEQTIAVSLGKGRRDVVFGKYKTHNYNVQAISNRLDSTKRYVYALVWYVSNDSLLGEAWKIYGDKPETTKTTPAKRSYNFRNGTGWTTNDDGELVEMTPEQLDDFSNQMEEMGRQMDEQMGGWGKSFKFGKKNKKTTDTDNISSLQYSDVTSESKITTGADFLRQFNNLHTLFTELNDKYTDYRKCEGDEKIKMVKIMNLMAGTFTKASDMCGNYYNVLTKEQKKFVADQLRDMAKDAKISYFGDGFRSLANELTSNDSSFKPYKHETYRLCNVALAANGSFVTNAF